MNTKFFIYSFILALVMVGQAQALSFGVGFGRGGYYGPYGYRRPGIGFGIGIGRGYPYYGGYPYGYYYDGPGISFSDDFYDSDDNYWDPDTDNYYQ